MKIKLIEEKVNYIDREVDVEFPFYFHIDLNHGHDCEHCLQSGDCKFELEIGNQLKVDIFGVITETKCIKIVEKFDPQNNEYSFSIVLVYIDLEHMEEFDLDQVLLNEETYSCEEEFEDAKDRYYNWLEDSFILDNEE